MQTHAHIALITFILGIIALCLGSLYCFANLSGHSAVDPIKEGSYCFIPIFLAGLLSIFASGGKSPCGWLSAVMGILGFGFGYFVHHTGIMQAYEFWVKNGLLDKNPHSNWLLSGYLILALVLLVLVYIIFSKMDSRT